MRCILLSFWFGRLIECRRKKVSFGIGGMTVIHNNPDIDDVLMF